MLGRLTYGYIVAVIAKALPDQIKAVGLAFVAGTVDSCSQKFYESEICWLACLVVRQVHIAFVTNTLHQSRPLAVMRLEHTSRKSTSFAMHLLQCNFCCMSLSELNACRLQ